MKASKLFMVSNILFIANAFVQHYVFHNFAESIFILLLASTVSLMDLVFFKYRERETKYAARLKPNLYDTQYEID
jgi:hypothetical protein